MNPVLAGALGLVAGAGVWVAVAVLVPNKPELSRALALMTATRESLDSVEQPQRSFLSRSASWIGLPRKSIRADLVAIGRSPEDYLKSLVRTAAVAVVTPVLFAVLMAVAGVGLNPVVTTAAAIGIALVAWIAVDAEIRAEAEKARVEARRALALVLSLTAMALSGGAGVESALRAAASAGSGLAFERIRTALDRAALLNRPPWQTLGELGREIGVDAYEQLAATAALAGTEGARIRSSLTERAKSLRAQRLADIETQALAATERMSLPIVAMASAFVIIVGYPALERVLTGL
jgi:hypothetical protein